MEVLYSSFLKDIFCVYGENLNNRNIAASNRYRCGFSERQGTTGVLGKD
jgi:hypothetical protein